MTPENSLVAFDGKNIRRTWFNDEWWFVAVDIVAALTDSADPSGYLKDMRRRDEGFAQGWGQIATPLPIETAGGAQKLNCVSTKGALRLIQSIPSKKAEPFKRWLAQVGYERIREIENPELAQERAKEYYELKGYPKDWIDKRLRGIAVRQELTEEWKKRGIEEQREYAILTNEISQATFGVPIKIHKEIKGLDPKFKNQNLRDHMTDLEIIFSMLGERLTTEATRKKDARSFTEGLDAAKEGGTVAGRARQDAEKTFGIKVVSPENYLDLSKKRRIGKEMKDESKKLK